MERENGWKKGESSEGSRISVSVDLTPQCQGTVSLNARRSCRCGKKRVWWKLHSKRGEGGEGGEDGGGRELASVEETVTSLSCDVRIVTLLYVEL